MDTLKGYSQDYRQARAAFRGAAKSLNAIQEHYDICPAEAETGSLTLDVAILGPADPAWSLLVSSGLHGVEGFVGSAIQLMYMRGLEAYARTLRGRIILLHAINPFGFYHLRRVNENNIDLNRNFLASDQPYARAPPGYAGLDAFLNPPSPPRQPSFYLPLILWKIATKGLTAIKQAVAGGQYDYPMGLFFGGWSRARSVEVLAENVVRWIGTPIAVHIDFHTGLGRYGKCKLIAPAIPKLAQREWYANAFGHDIELPSDGANTRSPKKSKRIAYPVTGDIGSGIASETKGIDYRFLAAEFGTYSPIRVLGALRTENQAHFYAPANSDALRRAKAELVECFCPSDPAWRRSVAAQGVSILRRAEQAADGLAAVEKG